MAQTEALGTVCTTQDHYEIHEGAGGSGVFSGKLCPWIELMAIDETQPPSLTNACPIE